VTAADGDVSMAVHPDCVHFDINASDALIVADARNN
jgi:hypothetical protein